MAHSATDRTVLAIVDRIYEAAERPERWPETIRDLGDFIGGRRDFWLSNPSTRTGGLVPSRASLLTGCYGSVFLSRSDLRELDQYAGEYGELIVRFLKIVFLSTLSSQKDIAGREAIGLLMTRRYLQAFRGMQASPSSWKSVGRRLIAALWEDGRTFNGENLRLITPHLDRALRLQMRLNATQLQADIISGALDHLTLGVILVDRAGIPIWHNRRAQEIMASADGLRIARNGLVGASPADTQVLRKLVTAAVCEGAQGLLALERGVESRPLLLIAMPLKPAGAPDLEAGGSPFACGVLFVNDPDETAAPTPESLRRAFGLTYREAQTAIAVSRGQGLKAAAESMGVALTTARSHLQQAFAKTGTSQQAELAALVHRTLMHVRHDD
jgi:DNA-binding CsgD family transcriptional regulator/PAS domain-containing protein